MQPFVQEDYPSELNGFMNFTANWHYPTAANWFWPIRAWAFNWRRFNTERLLLKVDSQVYFRLMRTASRACNFTNSHFTEIQATASRLCDPMRFEGVIQFLPVASHGLRANSRLWMKVSKRKAGFKGKVSSEKMKEECLMRSNRLRTTRQLQ